ncbi:MAG: PEP-CTERM sorting domain-containing protein [Phycisphaerae bacterium]
MIGNERRWMKGRVGMWMLAGVVWSVALPAGPAMGQSPPAVTVWLQARDGSNKVTMGVSQTAVIQLWASLAGGDPNRPIVNLSVLLKGYAASFGKTLNYEVAGFNDITIPNSGTQRGGRGPNIVSLLPNAHMDEYAYFNEDPSVPLNGTSGIVGTDRSFLMDEIIIHGVADNTAAGPDLATFAMAPAEPIGFYMAFDPVGGWSVAQLASVARGTGDFLGAGPFLINVTPEPATLGLIALGGLAVIRRRR